MLQRPVGEGDLRGRTRPDLGPKEHAGPAFQQGHETDLGKGARPARGPRTAKGGGVGFGVRRIQRGPIHAHQAPVAILPALRPFRRDGAHPVPIQPLQGLRAQPCARLGDRRTSRVAQAVGRRTQPAKPFDQHPQHLAVGRLHVQRQRDDVVHHHLRGQLPNALAMTTGRREHPIDFRTRNPAGQHPHTDKIRDPHARRQPRDRPRHRAPPPGKTTERVP